MFRDHRHHATREAATRGSGSILPKVIAVVAVVGLVRMLASHKRGHGETSSWRDRRREMVAELHRELHREDDVKADAAKPEADIAEGHAPRSGPQIVNSACLAMLTFGASSLPNLPPG
jgi:hypothetical protein